MVRNAFLHFKRGLGFDYVYAVQSCREEGIKLVQCKKTLKVLWNSAFISGSLNCKDTWIWLFSLCKFCVGVYQRSLVLIKHCILDDCIPRVWKTCNIFPSNMLPSSQDGPWFFAGIFTRLYVMCLHGCITETVTVQFLVEIPVKTIDRHLILLQ